MVYSDGPSTSAIIRCHVTMEQIPSLAHKSREAGGAQAQVAPGPTGRILCTGYILELRLSSTLYLSTIFCSIWLGALETCAVSNVCAMLSPLTLSPTSYPGHWMDSSIHPVVFSPDLASVTDFPSHLPSDGLPVPYGNCAYCPAIAGDRNQVYYPPETAARERAGVSPDAQESSKEASRWAPEEAEHGLGLGLAGVTTSRGITYVLSRPPVFLDVASSSAAPDPVSEPPEGELASHISAWPALTEFLETTYSLLDSPATAAGLPTLAGALVPTDAASSPREAMAVATAPPSPVLQLHESGSPRVHVLPLTAPLAIAPSPTLEPCVTVPETPASPGRALPHTRMPLSRPARVLAGLLASPRARYTRLPLERTPTLQSRARAVAGILLSPRAPPSAAAAPRHAYAHRRSRVRFVPTAARPPVPAARPTWFQREDTLWRSSATASGSVSAWDQRRVQCVAFEAQLALGRRRSAADVMEETRRDEAEEAMWEWAGRLRFTLCGLPYAVVLRQQQRRCAGAPAAAARRRSWLAREEEIWVLEREKRIRVWGQEV
ncbi:hypothetical protein GGX14DRAFT_390409 [Mycena pura]|uniref:Uncharacterized protein n=1 Tax=Mycena pura TaxID=153505 RepID=A0AAD6YFL6_9AGAR|nr:hypothetical protein GGX14DRAFT_390409 [Mycena pura]